MIRSYEILNSENSNFKLCSNLIKVLQIIFSCTQFFFLVKFLKDCSILKIKIANLYSYLQLKNESLFNFQKCLSKHFYSLIFFLKLQNATNSFEYIPSEAGLNKISMLGSPMHIFSYLDS